MKRKKLLASLLLASTIFLSISPNMQVHADGISNIGDTGSANTAVTMTTTGSSTNVVVSIPAEITLQKKHILLDDSELKPFLCNGIVIQDEDYWFYPYSFNRAMIPQSGLSKTEQTTPYGIKVVNEITSNVEADIVATVDTISIVGDVAPGEVVDVCIESAGFRLSPSNASAPTVGGYTQFIPTCKNVKSCYFNNNIPIFYNENNDAGQYVIQKTSTDSDITVPVLFGTFYEDNTKLYEGVNYTGTYTFNIRVRNE